MTKDVLYLKLDSLRNCIERLESKQPFDAGDLANDFDLQDIVSINLERAVQISVDIAAHIISQKSGKSPLTMADSFSVLEQLQIIDSMTATNMRKTVGLRNILVHEYSKINWTIVSVAAIDGLDVFREYSRQILANAD